MALAVSIQTGVDAAPSVAPTRWELPAGKRALDMSAPSSNQTLRGSQEIGGGNEWNREKERQTDG